MCQGNEVSFDVVCVYLSQLWLRVMYIGNWRGVEVCWYLLGGHGDGYSAGCGVVVSYGISCESCVEGGVFDLKNVLCINIPSLLITILVIISINTVQIFRHICLEMLAIYHINYSMTLP